MPMHGAVSARSSYKSASVDLCNALDEIARVIHLCMSTIHPQSLSAFVACRLIIPLKKNSGVSPTDIGEVSWCIIEKSILRVVGEEEYGDRMREVKCGVFTPLVFSTTGGMGKEITVAYKCLAELIAQK